MRNMMTTFYGKKAKEVLIDNCNDYENIVEGTQVKYNHSTCPAGEDNRNRLYVKNVDGAYLWHCHNCGDSGYYRPKETTKRITDASAYVDVSSTRNFIPYSKLKETTYKINDMPIEAQLWLARYEIDDILTNEYGICYTTYPSRGVVLPIFGEDYSSVIGYQIRTFNEGYKYISYTNYRHSYLKVDSYYNLLLVTEDLLSSYKLHKAGFSTLCLLGTKMSFNALSICGKFAKVVLWLDDDEAGHSSMLRLTKEISPVCTNTTAIVSAQPKEFSIEKLSEMEF